MTAPLQTRLNRARGVNRQLLAIIDDQSDTGHRSQQATAVSSYESEPDPALGFAVIDLPALSYTR